MKNVFALVAFAGLASVAAAQVTYTDSQNELFDNSFDHLDIANVVVSHDASNITFTINLRGSIDATTWGKYCVGIDTGAVGGSSANGWARNVSWGANGVDWFCGSWADDGGGNFGAELRPAGNEVPASPLYATWLSNFPGTGSSTGNTQVISISRAVLGLTGNDTFRFDIFTTGGGNDPGVDHLSRSDMSTPGWGDQSTSGNFLVYTIPTPGATALLGLGGLLAARRRRA